MRNKTVTQVQEVQKVPGRINPRRNMLRHIVVKLTKIKDNEKLLKATRDRERGRETQEGGDMGIYVYIYLIHSFIQLTQHCKAIILQ